jgi:hypothetical protein
MTGRVITKNQSMAQVRLDSGERVLVSFTQNEVAIFKLGFFGFVPLYKIWKSSLDPQAVLDINPLNHPHAIAVNWVRSFDPVQSAIDDVLTFRSIAEMKERLKKR